jgi:putative ABC transport system permease protein
MTTLLQDLRFGVRMLARQPGFAFIAILTLALGIGANTAIFSVVYGALMQPLTYTEPDRLVVPVSYNYGRNSDASNVTYADYLDWKNEQTFESVAVMSLLATADLTSDSGEPERIRIAQVTADYFEVMRTVPLVGRTFNREEFDPAGTAWSLILSEGLWTRRFGRDPSILDQKIYLNGRPWSVVGVAPSNSIWPGDQDILLPLEVGPNPDANLLRRDNMVFVGIARLKPGQTIAQADAAMGTIADRLAQEFPESRTGWKNRAVDLRQYIVGNQLRLSLIVLLAAVGFVLLIACVNVANLSLARVYGREREIAIRLALGAGRWRLVRQMLTESLMISVLGGGVGFLLGAWGLDVLLAIAPPDTPRLAEIGVNGTVLVFSALIAMGTAILCGLVPASQCSRIDLNNSLKESARSTTGGRRGGLMRSVLVVSEVSLSLALLVGAGLMIRSFLRVQHIDPGFEVDRLVTMQLNARSVRYKTDAEVINLYETLADRIKSSTGVSDAAVSSAIPVGGGGFYLGRVFLREGAPEPPNAPDYPAQWNVASPGYFRTSGTKLLEGRDFSNQDRADTTKVIVINRTLANRMFPDENPLGKRIRSWRDENQLREIVGIVEDVRYFGRDDEIRGLVYVPHTQTPWRSMLMTVRTQGEPGSVIDGIRSTIASVDKDLAIANLRTMIDSSNRSVAPRRLSAILLTAFSVLALVLAVIGIYGVLSYSVGQRTREIGIRIGLGAGRGDVVRLILTEGMKLALIGIAGGLALAFGLTRVMKTLLFETTATDPLTFALIPLVLIGVALVACYVPARRATKVDPIVALRYE